MIKQVRIDKTIELMKKEGLEGVIYAVGANFQYLLDAHDYFWQRACMTNIFGRISTRTMPEAFLYLTAKGDLTVFTIYQKKDYFLNNYNNVVVCYMDQFEDYFAPYVHEKTIGLGVSCNEYFKDMLKEIDKDIITKDAEDLLWSLRVIKDEDEIKRLRKVAKFTDDAVMATVNKFHMGMSQNEAENLLIEYGMEHGIEDLSFPPTIGLKTRNTITSSDVEYYDRYWKMQDKTGLAFDVGYMNDGYCSDFGRTLYIGKAPEMIKSAYFALEEGQKHMCASIVPYKTNVNELYDLVHEKVTELGHGKDLRFQDSKSLGHQIGIDCHEFPMVNPKFDYILRPGMVFASEPKMYFNYECYMRVEDIILVTETGAEFLTNFPRDMFEIDL